MLVNTEPYIAKLVSYIEQTLSLAVKTSFWEDEGSIPLLLRERYSFLILRIAGSGNLVLIDTNRHRNTPATISKHVKMLSRYWSGGVIYSHSSLSATDRARLIKARIPFIIPAKQLYLPFMGMDLKEFFPPERKASGTLSPTAQVLILGKLYGHEWIRESPSRMSGKIGLSNMSIGRAFSELELHHIASIRRSGKEKTLVFDADKRELWDITLPLLRSPVTSSYTIPFRVDTHLVRAGESALTCYSLIQEPDQPTFAMFNRQKDIIMEPAEQKEISETDMTIQKWAYDPRLFSRNGIADPLSVYLEFKDSQDERIEAALDYLIKKIPW